MKKSFPGLGFLAGAVLCVSAIMTSSVNARTLPQVPWEIEYVDGSVQIFRTERTVLTAKRVHRIKTLDYQFGVKLLPGDRIKTGPRSRVRWRIGPSAPKAFKLDLLEKSELEYPGLDLHAGNAVIRIPADGHFKARFLDRELRSAAVVPDRGALFWLSRDDQGAQVAVLTGSVLWGVHHLRAGDRFKVEGLGGGKSGATDPNVPQKVSVSELQAVLRGMGMDLPEGSRP